MVTVVEEEIYTGNTTSAGYDDPKEWEVDTDNDLVTDDELQVGEARAEEWGGLGSGGQFTIAGATTDATRYRKLTVADGHSTGGPTINPHNGGYNQHGALVTEDYFHLDGFTMEPGNATSNECVRVDGDDKHITITRCKFQHGTVAQQDGIYFYHSFGASTHSYLYIYNCVFLNFERAGLHAQNYTSSGAAAPDQTIYIYNCSFFNNGSGDGIGWSWGTAGTSGSCTLNIKNSLADTFNSTGTFTGNQATTVNSTDNIFGNDPDTDIPNIHSYTATRETVSDTFNDLTTGGTHVIFTETAAGSEDLTLQDHADNRALEYGSDLTEFSDDFNGDARPSGYWDAGAYQVSTAPSSGKIPLTSPLRFFHTLLRM